MIPEGRVLIDTAKSFVFNEGGLKGVLMASRLSGLSPNLTGRFTSGTLISAYEVYEAVREGIAVPFRKSDPEVVRRFADLKKADRGGMMLQPVPGLYEEVLRAAIATMQGTTAAVKAAAYLFSELDRLKILQMDFFEDNEKITDRRQLTPDPAVRTEFFRLLDAARQHASARLSALCHSGRWASRHDR